MKIILPSHTNLTTAFLVIFLLISFHVHSQNVSPVITSPDLQYVAADANLLFNTANGNRISISDADDDRQSVTINVTHGIFRLSRTRPPRGNGNGTSSLEYSGTIEDFNAALNNAYFRGNEDFKGEALITIITDDLEGGTDTAVITVRVGFDPSLTTIPGPQSVAEDSCLVFSGETGNPIFITDAGSNDQSVTLTVANGIFTLSGVEELTGTGNGTSSLSYAGSITDINAALDSSCYLGNPDFNGSDLVIVTTANGTGGFDIDTLLITVTAENDDPLISYPCVQGLAVNSILTFSEANNNLISVSDAENDDLSVTLIVSNGIFTLSTTSSLTGDGNGTDTLLYSGTLTALNTALDHAFFSGNDSFSGMASVMIAAADGNGGADTVTLCIFIHDTLVITVPGLQTGDEDINLVFHDAGSNRIFISDPGNHDQSITIAVTQGTFTLSTTSGLTGTGDGTGSLSYAGSITGINAALRNAFFTGNPDYYGDASLRITTDNGQGASDTAGIGITLHAVNDAPVITAPATQTVDEDAGLVFSAANGNPISISDPEDDVQDVTITVTNGIFKLSATTGLVVSGDSTDGLTFSGTLAAINAALDGALFMSTPEFSGSASLTIRCDDGHGGTGDALLVITITGMNDTPTGIGLSNASVEENQVSGTLVGTLTTTDRDNADTHTYTLVAGSGANDNGSFSITGNSLLTGAVFDFEVKSRYAIRIRTTDAAGDYYEEAFEIDVSGVNEAPYDIYLSSASIDENQPSNSTVGILTTADPETGDSHVYSLVSGDGSGDNASFNLSGNRLQTNVSFDYETLSSYSIRIRTTDDGGLWFEEAFIITVSDVNETPADIDISSSTTAENQPANTTIGILTTADPDAGNTHTYSLVAGTGSGDNGSFNIAGVLLRSNAPFDFETKSSYAVRIRTTDNTGLWFEKAFIITVTNINEAPTAISLTGASVPEGRPVNTVVGILSTADPDQGNTFAYSLVSGEGSSGNTSFNISGSSLRTSEVFDYETQSAYSVRIRTTDAGGLSFERAFDIAVTFNNQPPSDITLSGSAIAENQPSNTLVGNLAAVDPNPADSHTFTLVSGDGSTDNASFIISGSQLRTNASFDYEVKTTYTIRIRATDAGSLYYEESFTIGVANINEAPSDLTLSGTTIPENRPVNTLVGTFSATDQDVSDSHSYSLVAGTGSTDNGSFTITGNQLRTNAVFNFENKTSYSIRVRATDAGSLYTEKQFTVTVTNVNEAPADITLSSMTVAESQPVNTVVGTLAAVDPDAGNTFTYSLVSGEGSSGNESFNISGSTLRTSEVLDFESRSSYSIRIRARDGGGLSVEKIFIITVTFFNQAPAGISLSNASVAENQPANTLVGNVSAVDPNADEILTYTLVDGTGSADNGSFLISGNQLRTNVVFDHENKASCSIRVRVTDAGSLYTEEQFIITITNVNETPVELLLSNAAVAENQPVNTVVGILSTTDPDEGDTHAYSLVSGTGDNDNGSFNISGAQLRASETFSFEIKSSYSVRIRTTDAGGRWYENAFVITVTDVNETPTALTLTPVSVPESQPVNTVVGTFATTDPDIGSTHTYSLVSGAGSSGNSSFNISGLSLRTSAVFDYETQSSYSIRIRTTDNGGLYYERVFTITVSLYNEAPEDISLSNNLVAENQPSNTLVGYMAAIDPNTSDSHTFTLVSGTGSTDNSSFTISGNQLRTNLTFNYETGSSYSIRIRATDAGSLYVEKQFIISVTDLNEAPSLISLSASSVDENRPVNTVIGTLATEDPDEDENHVYSLVSGNGSDDNGSFNISGNRLRTDESFNYETKASYTIRLRSTDEGGLWREQVFILTVNDVNEAPVAIALSNTSVSETQPVNTVVGTFSSTDPDAGSTHTYSLVAGTGSSGNSYFNISGSTLRTGAVLDVETQPSFSIRVRTTDAGGLFYERVFTITTVFFNQEPTDIVLSNASVAENQPVSTLVGNLTAMDPNASDRHTFTLVSGTGSTDNSSFTVSGDQVLTRAVFNYESKSSYSVLIRVTDAGGLYYEKRFTIAVTNVNEPPVASNVSISRPNNRIGTENTGTFTYTDPETGNFMEGAHIYKWYRRQANGTIQWIDSVSAIHYMPVMADGGDSICFEVTPRDNLNLLGNPARSPFVYVNAAPAAGNVLIHAPDLSVGRNVYGRFAYQDLENNFAGRHTYQWYRSVSPSGTGTLIAGAGDTIYKLRVSEDSRYIRFVVIPVATAGSSPGIAVSSAWIGPVRSSVPIAVISGSDTICHNGPKARITVNLTGEPNWTIRYRRVYGGRSEEATISNIQHTPFAFDAPGNGTYTLLSVSDNNYTSGSVTGTAIISYYPAATAVLTGTSQVCQQNALLVPMTVDFSGTAPWSFILRRNSEDTTFYHVTQDPFVFMARRPGIYKIAGMYDRYCQGDTIAGYGTAVISYITSPKAVLSGIDTTCPGDTAILRVQLEGTGPFSITYLRNGSNAKTISNIRQLNYALKVVGNGTYTLSAVSDQVRSGCVSGSGTVAYYNLPTANISGNGNICEHTNADLKIALTGTPPWNFSYHRNTEPPTLITHVTSPTRYITVSKAGTYTLTGVSDQYCNGTVSGATVVTVTPAPAVTITGLNPAYSTKETMVPVFGTPKNGTFIPPLVMVHDTSFFLPKYFGPGIHTLVYQYRDPQTGCYGYDTASVAVLIADAEITFPENDKKKFFCYNEPPFTIFGNNTKNTTGTFAISGGKGLVDNHNNTATLYPSLLDSGIYTVTYRYFYETFLEVEESFELGSVDELRIIGFDKTTYCDDENRVKLNGNITNAVFSGSAVTGNISAGFYFEPRNARAGSDTLFYTYTTARGCTRQIIQPLIIHDAPDISFTVKDACISTSGSDSTAFINLTTSTDEILSWLWNFDDAGSNQNTSVLMNPKHRYSKDGTKMVTLTANTGHCESKKTEYFEFGAKPTADFNWATECYHEGRKIKFINQSASGTPGVFINGYQWRFYHGETYDSIGTRDAEFLFSDTGNYKIELIIHSNYGCTDRRSKVFPLRPTYLIQEGASYFEGFESGRAGWLSLSDGPVNSWVLGTPQNGFNAAAMGEYAWYTHITAQRPPKEHSYVTSPCFSFSGIKKPMIKFNLWRWFDEYRDGANLQYTADSGSHWHNIGKMDDGINWYNNYEITGNPGGRQTGWSGSNTVSPDIGWIEARHGLDELKGKGDVQFRIAYGSDSTAIGTQGLAFDNIWIGDRNKIVLIEHFTNAGDAASRSADSALDALANAYPYDIIDIQYHTSFPGVDPFNEQNKMDPATRILFYQLSRVPYSVVNGGALNFDYTDGHMLDPVLIRNQSLMNPQFNIILNTELVDNSLEVKAELAPLEILRNRQITLHLAIVERRISGISGANGDTCFESVLKSMLSSTSFTNNWDPAVDVKTITGEWNLKNIYNTDEIRVIAFLQDESTHEIYQAMINKFDEVVTGLEEENMYRSKAGAGFIAFPNPVNHEVFIRFDEVLTRDARADLFDINGRLVMTTELFRGSRLHSIAVEDCPEGFYFMRITSDNGLIGLQKLVISR